MKALVRLVVCLALCLGVGALGGFVTLPQIGTWYNFLAKPAWTPPNFVFPLVWTGLYLLMAVSLWVLWDRSEPSPERTRAIALFLLQLALNAVWPAVFFGLHALVGGLVVIVLLVTTLAACTTTAFRVRPVAGALLVPYLAWVVYATALNVALVIMN